MSPNPSLKRTALPRASWLYSEGFVWRRGCRLALRWAVTSVTGSYEGDLIRPLGLVTLYAAYAEGEIDELLSAIPSETPFDASKREWPVGRKLSYALKLIRKLKSDQLTGLTSALREAQTLFSKRNSLVHSQIFAGGRVVSHRPNASIQKVAVDDLVQLAEQIFACKEQLSMHRSRHLLPVLRSSGSRR